MVAPPTPIWHYWPFATFVVAILVYRLWATRRRRAELAATMQRLGFRPWPDDSLPRDLYLDDTVFNHWSRLVNVYEGSLNGVDLVLFEIWKQGGKSTWTRTVLAARTSLNVFAGHALTRDFTIIQRGEWWLLYQPVGILVASRSLPAQTVEALLDHVRHTTSTTESVAA